MRSSLSIASVTLTLRHILHHAFTGVSGPSKVTSLPPASGDQDDRTSRINIFLYQVSPNAHRRDAVVPTRRADGTMVQAPAEMLELGYLLTFHGDPETFVPERLLGNTLALLAANRTLTPERVSQALSTASPEELRLALADSSLPAQRPAVGLSLFPLGAEALRQLWSSLFAQQAYRLSIALQASTVIVAADVEPARVEPVAVDGVVVHINPPRITRVSPGVVIGGTLEIDGRGFDQRDLVVLIGSDATPVRGERVLSQPDRRLTVELTAAVAADAGLVAGPVAVQVRVGPRGVPSERAWFVLQATAPPAPRRVVDPDTPRIASVTAGASVGDTLELTGAGFDHPELIVWIGQAGHPFAVTPDPVTPEGRLTVALSSDALLAAQLAPGATPVQVQRGATGPRSALAWFVLAPRVVDAQMEAATLTFAIMPAPDASQIVTFAARAGDGTRLQGQVQRHGDRFAFPLDARQEALTVDVSVDGIAAPPVEVRRDD